MSDPVSYSEFARILDVSPSYVTKLRAAGRLVLTDDGKKIHVEASQQRIVETESGSPQHVAARNAHAKRRDGAAVPRDRESATDSRAYWEKREAAARAQTREIELAKMRGDLVETSAVKYAGAEAGAVLRAALENIPDKLAPLLAEGDPERERRIYAHLRDHVEQLLNEMSHKLESLAHAPADPQSR